MKILDTPILFEKDKINDEIRNSLIPLGISNSAEKIFLNININTRFYKVISNLAFCNTIIAIVNITSKMTKSSMLKIIVINNAITLYRTFVHTKSFEFHFRIASAMINSYTLYHNLYCKISNLTKSVDVVLIRHNENTGLSSITTKGDSRPSSSINDESGESLVDTTLSILRMLLLNFISFLFDRKGKIPA
ncbi:hypothetical protein H8356DRAFT_1346177 [Neocallimastix lanati (nom. inval.)]|nr:hypothetical protein H8356DRAFT_1346177 [Neocallimastix sp. JGI-2020a]